LRGKLGRCLDGPTDYAAGITGQGVLQRFTSHNLTIIH
jgi:hypothetical protein